MRKEGGGGAGETEEVRRGKACSSWLVLLCSSAVLTKRCVEVGLWSLSLSDTLSQASDILLYSLLTAEHPDSPPLLLGPPALGLR